MRRGSGLLAIAVTALPLLMACSNPKGGGLLGQPPPTTVTTKAATSTTVAGTSVSNPGRGTGTAGTALSPDQMLQALAGEITDAESPKGFLNGFTAQLGKRDQPDADMTKYNALGQVVYGTKMGGTEDDPLIYVVLPTESDATAYQQKALLKFFTQNVQNGTFAPTGIAEPARCLTATLVNNAGMTYGGGSACVARAGIVVVIGESQVGGAAKAGNNNNAIAVTMLGLNHIPIAVAAFTPRATATSAATLPPVADATQRPPSATQPRPSASSAATTAATRPPSTQPPAVTQSTVVVQSSGATRPPTLATRPPPTGPALYSALLGTTFDPRELPAGFRAPSVVTGSPDASDRQHLVVGEVDVRMQGPDTIDIINYTVFQSDAEAQAAYEGELSFAQGDAVLGSFVPAGFPTPARCIFGQGTAVGQRYGFTSCLVLVGNTYITAYSRLSGGGQRGSDASAIALATAALSHLTAVRAML